MKYRIRAICEAMSMEEYICRKAEIVRRCKISRRTFHRWMNIMLEDEQDIPAQKLDIIAEVLGTTADDLKNYKKKVNKAA